MEKKIKRGEYLQYRQESGDTTAWLPKVPAKMQLEHTGDPGYRKIFYILVAAGTAYLALVFGFVH